MTDKFIIHQTISIKLRNFCFENVEKLKFHVAQAFSVFNPVYTDVILILMSWLGFPSMTKLFSNKLLNSPWVNDAILRCIRKEHVWYASH